MDHAYANVMVGAVAFLVLIAFATIRAALVASPWSLADALSEEAEVTALDAQGGPMLDATGKPVMITALRGSSSRLIALLGLIGILFVFLGFGLVLLWRFAANGQFPDDQAMSSLRNFLFGGMTMFAPYLINKFASVFDWMTPKK